MERSSRTLEAQFLQDRRGSVAPIFAAFLVPAVMVIGLAVDYGRATNAQIALQRATDAAALAAAVAKSDPQAAAIASFTANTSENELVAGARPVVKVSSDGVQVSSAVDYQTTFASVFAETIPVTASASAKAATTAAPSVPVCLLALSKSPEAMKFWGTSDLIAPNCAAYSNSTAGNGLVTGGSGKATAALFKVAGGYSGTGFSPAPIGNAPALPDPYAGKFTEAWLSANGIQVPTTCYATKTTTVRRDTTFTSGGTNKAIRFCGGLQVSANASAIFQPGVYIIDGTFDVQSGGWLIARKDVTIILGGNSGNYGVLTVQGGGYIELSAPTSGPLAGMAIIQPTVQGYANQAQPLVTHTIIGGGRKDIVGMIYLPQAKLRVTGNGGINDGLPQYFPSSHFGVVADFVELEGNGALYLRARSDHVTAQMPPMVTTTDETTSGARLTQ
jgi:Flp pilus assembly protein TadG